LAKAQDAEAWRRLVDLYGPLIYAWCRSEGLEGAEAADVVQDVFISVLDSLPAFHAQPGKGSFRAWLRTVTRRRIADYIQRRGSVRGRGGTTAQQILLEVPASVGLPEGEGRTGASVQGDSCGPLSGSTRARALEWLRSEFGPKTWQAFWLIVVERQRPEEAASKLGMSLMAVYKAKSRVMRRIRQELDGLEGLERHVPGG